MLLVSLLLTLATRLWYQYAFPFKVLARDVTCHLILVKSIRENGGRILDRYSRFLLDDNNYPNAFHKWIALLRIPQKFLEDHGGLIPLACDLLFLLMIAGVIQLTGGTHMAWLLLFPVTRLLWGLEERAFLFNPRAFCALFGNLYFACTILYFQTQDWRWLLGSVLGFLVMSTTSMFVWQAVVFISVLMSIFCYTWGYIAVAAACFAATAILTGGYNIKVLRGIILHGTLYKTHLLKTNWGLRSFYRDWLDVFYHINFRKLRYHLFQNPLAKMVTSFPVIIPFMAMVFQTSISTDPWMMLVLSCLFLVPVIATESLKFLGEPDRYLEYAILPAMVLLAREPVSSHSWAFGFALLTGILAIVFQLELKRLEGQSQNDADAAYEDLARFIQTLSESTILTIPFKCAIRLVYGVEKHRYVANFINVGEGLLYSAYTELFPHHSSYPGSNLALYVEKYGVDYIVLDKANMYFLDKKLKGAQYYDFRLLEPVYDTPFFTVFKPGLLVRQSLQENDMAKSSPLLAT